MVLRAIEKKKEAELSTEQNERKRQGYIERKDHTRLR
jgi:hypothetical protein